MAALTIGFASNRGNIVQIFYTRQILFRCIALAATLSTGCKQAVDSPAAIAKLSQLQSELSKSNASVADLAAKVQALQKASSTQMQEIWKLNSHASKYENAVFDPVSGPGFVRLDTSLGSIALAVKDIRPYADGVEIKLAAGNLTAGTLSGVKGKATFGSSEPQLDYQKDDSAFSKWADWKGQLKEAPINVTEDLKPGSWNVLQIRLPGVQAQTFGHLEISLDADQVKLRKP